MGRPSSWGGSLVLLHLRAPARRLTVVLLVVALLVTGVPVPSGGSGEWPGLNLSGPGAAVRSAVSAVFTAARNATAAVTGLFDRDAEAAPAPAPAADPPREEEEEKVDTEARDAGAKARREGRRVELPSRRGESTTTFVNPDGSETVELSAGPVRVRDASGAWRGIDTRLSAAAGRVRPNAVKADVTFSNGGDTTLATLTDSAGRKLTMSWPAALPRPRLDGAAATYPDVLPGADLVLRATSLGYEQTVVLRERTTSPFVIRIPIRLRGMSLSKGEGGGLLLTADDGTIVATTPAPRMWGAKTDPRSLEPTHAADVRTDIEGSGDDLTLVLRPDPAFLANPAVTYPLTIDPSPSLNNLGDTFVQNDFSSNQDAATELKAGSYNGGSNVARSLLKFDTTSLAGKHILSATLKLYEYHSYSCTPRAVNVYRNTANWNPSTVTWASGMPATSGTVWGTANVAYGYSASCPDNWVSFTGLEQLIDYWAQGTYPNYGFQVRAADETDSYGWKRFYSENHGSAVPTLTVSYNSDPAIGSGTLAPASSTKAADLTPTLTGKYTDVDAGDTGYVRYEIYRDSDSVLIASGNGTNVSPNGMSPWTVPAAKLVDGVKYRWRAQAWDGVDASPWSATYYYTPDLTAPTGDLTAPARDSVVSGTVAMTATPTDATSGVAQVDFYVTANGIKRLVGSDTSSTGGWTVNLDTTTLPDGPAVVAAEYSDAAGNDACCVGGASVAVVVANAPSGAMPWTGSVGAGELESPRVKARVLASSGRLTMTRNDIVLGGRGPAATMALHYDSGTPTKRFFGPGWRSTLDESLAPRIDGSVVHLDAEGREVVYQPVTAAGLLATSWNNTSQTGTPVATRVDSTVNFNWGTASPQAGVNTENFSTRWTGLIDVPTTGDWTFTTNADDGVRLTVDGAWVISDWANHAAADRSGTTTLTAGKHVVQLDYYDATSYASVVLNWAGPGIAKQVVPASALSRVTGYGAGPAGIYDAVTVDSTGLTRTLTAKGGEKRTFLADGRLLSVRDANGNGVVTGFDSTGRAARLCFAAPADADACATADAVLTIAYDSAGRVSTATDGMSAVWRYAYDAGGRLSTVTDPLTRVTTYGYDASGRITSSTSPLSETSTVAYDANGRVTALRSARHIAASLAGTTLSYGVGTVSVTSPKANAMSPVGASTTYTVDGSGRIAMVVDPLGRQESRTFDSASNVLTEADGLGRTTTRTYDSRGNMLTRTDPRGGVTTFTYDSGDRVLTETDAGNRVTTHVYDANGNETSRTEPGSRTTTWTYDTYGQVLSEVEPRGNVAGATASQYATTFTYDARGNRLTETDPLGHVRSSTYDGHGNVLTSTDPLLRVTTNTYDLMSNRLSTTNPAGEKTTYAYDVDGRLVTEVGPRGNVTGADPAIDRTTYTWWPDGLAKTTTNALSETTQYAYDPDGNLTSTLDPMLYDHTATFDLAGQRTQTVEPAGTTTTYTYDAAGQLTSVTIPTGTTTRQYDLDGNLIAELGPGNDANGQPLKTSSTYDLSGRMLTQTTPAGNVAGAPAGSYTTTYTYTPAGDTATVTDRVGRVTEYGYDAARNLTSLTDPSGAVTTVTFDRDGRETQRTVPATATVSGSGSVDAAGTSVAYVDLVADRAGTVTASLDWTTTTANLDLAIVNASGTVMASSVSSSARPEIATYAAAAAGTYRARVTAVSGASAFTVDGSRPSSEVTTTSYNAADEVTTVVDSRGTTTYTYDSAGRQTGTTLPDSRTRALVLDVDGRLQSSTDSAGTVSYTHDNADRLKTITDQNGATTTYTYDANGQQSGVTTGTTSYTYTRDTQGRLMTTSGFYSSSYSYSDSVNRTTTSYSSGERDESTFDGDGRVTQLRYKESSTASPWLVVDHAYDAQGNLVSVTDSTASPGTVTATFGYDAQDRLTSESALLSTGTWSGSYVFDAQGNRTSATRGGATTTYAYDASGQVVSRTAPGGAVTLYQHDADGRLVRTTGASAATYAWSSDAYLTGVTTGAGTTSFAYDTVGKRLSKTAGGVTTTYSYQGEALRSETSSGGTVSYTYDDNGAPLAISTGGSTYSYHYDHHGSVIALTDASHTVVARYVYDAWGNVLEETGSTALRAANPYTFLGRLRVRRDAETGLYLMGQRYYDPATGRFLSRDPLRPDDDLSPYVYSGNNPVRYTDATGLSFPDEQPPPYQPPPPPTRKMPSNYRATSALVRYIANNEGLELKPYNDPTGHCTIGYGHLISYYRCTSSDYASWGTITKARAWSLLVTDVRDKGEAPVKRFVKVGLWQKEFDALTSFAFNTGGKYLQAGKGYTLGDAINSRRYADVPKALMRYVYSRGVRLKGLVRRRCEEGQIFRYGRYSNFTPCS